MIKLNIIINEAFKLPSDVEIQAEKLAQFIASIFLKKFKSVISSGSLQSDESILKFHEYYRLAKQYRNEGLLLFGVMKENEITDWGEATMRIYSKNKLLPDVILKVKEGGSHVSNDGYVEDTKNPQEIFIMVDEFNFTHSFKKSTEELTDTIKHELRHWKQFTDVIGLPKTKVLNRKTDVLGFRDVHGYAAREPHYMRDIEFKPNLHSYAFHIKRYLNRNLPETQWKKEFKDMMLGVPVYTGNANVDHILDNIKNMKKKDTVRWKQFVKELYKLIFIND